MKVAASSDFDELTLGGARGLQAEAINLCLVSCVMNVFIPV